MNFDRILGNIYWVELPKLMDDYFTKMKSNEFYSWSDEFVSDHRLVMEVIDSMLRGQIENYWDETHFSIIQKDRKDRVKGQKCYISKSDAIKLCMDLDLIEVRERFGGHFQYFIDRIPTDKWIDIKEIQEYDSDRVLNLQDSWIFFKRLSLLAPYLEEHRSGISF